MNGNGFNALQQQILVNGVDILLALSEDQHLGDARWQITSNDPCDVPAAMFVAEPLAMS